MRRSSSGLDNSWPVFIGGMLLARRTCSYEHDSSATGRFSTVAITRIQALRWRSIRCVVCLSLETLLTCIDSETFCLRDLRLSLSYPQLQAINDRFPLYDRSEPGSHSTLFDMPLSPLKLVDNDVVYAHFSIERVCGGPIELRARRVMRIVKAKH